MYEDQKITASSFVSIDKYQNRLKITATIKFTKSISSFEFFSSDKLQRKQKTLTITSTIKCMVINFTCDIFHDILLISSGLIHPPYLLEQKKKKIILMASLIDYFGCF